MAKKHTESKNPSYKIDDDIPFNRLDFENPEYGVMKNLKIGSSFPFPESRSNFVFNARTHFHLHRPDEYCFGIKQERNKKGVIKPGIFRCWRIDVSKRRKSPKRKLNKS